MMRTHAGVITDTTQKHKGSNNSNNNTNNNTNDDNDNENIPKVAWISAQASEARDQRSGCSCGEVGHSRKSANSQTCGREQKAGKKEKTHAREKRKSAHPTTHT
jgi:hypothetical protein